jgi:hypothetical protein
MKLHRSLLAATLGLVAVSGTIPATASAQLLGRNDSLRQEIQYRAWSPYWGPRYDDGYYARGYDDGYYAYGYAPTPRGRYDRRGAYDRDTPAPGSSSECLGNSGADSSFPSWKCR